MKKEKEVLKDLKEIIIKKNFGHNIYLLGEEKILLLQYNKNLKNFVKEITFLKKSEYKIYGGFEGSNKKDFLILNYKLGNQIILNIFDVKEKKSLTLSLISPLDLYEYDKITHTLIFSCGKIAIFLKIDEDKIENLLTLKNIYFDCKITDIKVRNKKVKKGNNKNVSDLVLFSDVKNSVHVYELFSDNEIKYLVGDFKGRDVKKTGWLNDNHFYSILKNNSILFFSIIEKKFKVFKEKDNFFKDKESPLALFENSLYYFFKMKTRFNIMDFFLLNKIQIEEFLLDCKNSFLFKNIDNISFAGLLLLDNGDIKLILNFTNVSHSKIKDETCLKNLYNENLLVKNKDDNSNIFSFDLIQKINSIEV